MQERSSVLSRYEQWHARPSLLTLLPPRFSLASNYMPDEPKHNTRMLYTDDKGQRTDGQPGQEGAE